MDSRAVLRGTPCRSCGVEVVFARTANQRQMPVEVEPDPTGNVILLDSPEGLCIQVVPTRVGPVFPGLEQTRYMPHFARCKDAKSWRKAN